MEQGGASKNAPPLPTVSKMSTAASLLNNFVVSLKHTRPFFQAGLSVLALGAVLSLFDVTFHLLALTGAELVSFELWRLLTHFIVERNPLLMLWSLYCLHHASTLIEPAWGTTKFVTYVALVQLLSLFAVALVALLSYIFADSLFYYYMTISGLSSSCAAVLVAVKQYLPDSILLTTPLGRIKNTHLPAIALCAAFVLALVGELRWEAVLQILFGIQVSWMYLRFYQWHEDGEPRGDPSYHFTWASLFPSRMQPLMDTFATALFSLLVRLRVCKPIVRQIDVTQLDSINVILPGLQTRDTERRRQKALRDLTERLSRAQRVETAVWPDMEDPDADADRAVTPDPQEDSPSEQAHLHLLIEKPTEELETPKASSEDAAPKENAL